MSYPNAALPHNNRPEIREEFKAQPAEAQPAGCPMCRRADQIVVDIPTKRHVAILAYYVGVSQPEIDEGDEIGYTDPKPGTYAGVRCLACNWAYTGPDAAAKLVPLE